VETFYTVSLVMPDDGDAPGLELHQLHFGETSLAPGDADTFTSGVGFTLEFERDRSGRVVAFYIDAARTRDVRAVRVR
jgi:hypothetical protein